MWGEGQLDTLRAIAAELPEGLQMGARIDLALFERDWERAAQLIVELQGSTTTSLPYAEMLERLGEDDRARTIFELRFTQSEEFPEEDRAPDWYTDRGRILAGLGRSRGGGRGGFLPGRLFPDDALAAQGLRVSALHLLANAGLAEEACAIIDDMLSHPTQLTVNHLRFEYQFDAIRDAPCFQAALERYG